MEPGGRRLRNAAIALFAERGYHGTGIRDLARRADLSTASLYHYMITKEDLLAEIMRDSLHLLIRAAEQTGTHGTPAERIGRLVQVHVLAHVARPLHTRVADDEMRSLSPLRHATITALRDRYEEFWRAAIEDGVASGDFRVDSPGLARLAALEMCTGVARWFKPEGTLPVEDVAARYAEMVLGLLGARDTLVALDPGAADEVHRLVAELWPEPGVTSSARDAGPAGKMSTASSDKTGESPGETVGVKPVAAPGNKRRVTSSADPGGSPRTQPSGPPRTRPTGSPRTQPSGKPAATETGGRSSTAAIPPAQTRARADTPTRPRAETPTRPRAGAQARAAEPTQPPEPAPPISRATRVPQQPHQPDAAARPPSPDSRGS
jgi:AcrR family transcriptional regulator